eukprot:3247018-Pyramimonas_sp.AAC.1
MTGAAKQSRDECRGHACSRRGEYHSEEYFAGCLAPACAASFAPHLQRRRGRAILRAQYAQVTINDADACRRHFVLCI